MHRLGSRLSRLRWCLGVGARRCRGLARTFSYFAAESYLRRCACASRRGPSPDHGDCLRVLASLWGPTRRDERKRHDAFYARVRLCEFTLGRERVDREIPTPGPIDNQPRTSSNVSSIKLRGADKPADLAISTIE